MTGILILTTGGTIDKVYFDAKSEFAVGEPLIGRILEEAMVGVPYRVKSLMQKDSLEVTAEDRQIIRDAVAAAEEDRVLITHGTDTMTDTAAVLEGIPGKTIVLTGALSPARFHSTDALFNIGSAVAAVQIAAPGVWIAMNGQVFRSGQVRKNREKNRFEAL